MNKLAIPLLVLCFFFVLTTFLAYFYAVGGEQRFLSFNLHRILELLDLRKENTLATWFSSVLFLATGLGFMLLGWGQGPFFTISAFTRRVFQIGAIGACYLSADEMASIHETFGHWLARIVNTEVGTLVDTHGFSWVLLFAPVGIFMLLWLAILLYRLIAQMPGQARNQAKFALLGALFFLPGVFALEMVQAYLAYVKPGSNVFPCFEEMFEVFGMYGLFLTTTTISTHYQL